MSLVLGVIAVVAIVAGVALLATSGDRGFADVSPDGLVVALPDDRELTPADIEAVRFGLAFRGYRMQDVDDVLDRLAAELRDRDTRITELARELDERSRSGRTAIAGTQPEPFRPPVETRLPQEAERPRVTDDVPPVAATPSPAAEVAAAVVAATPDPFRAAEPDPAPAAESEPVVMPEPQPEPAPEPAAPAADAPRAEPVSPAAWTPPAPQPEREPAPAAADAADDTATEQFSIPAEPSLFAPVTPAAEPPPTDVPLESATPDYVETVPLPETVSDDPALDPGQPEDPPAATPKPETEPVATETVPDLAQPAPEQPAEHRESDETAT